jgi:hypothetical protein
MIWASVESRRSEVTNLNVMNAKAGKRESSPTIKLTMYGSSTSILIFYLKNFNPHRSPFTDSDHSNCPPHSTQHPLPPPLPLPSTLPVPPPPSLPLPLIPLPLSLLLPYLYSTSTSTSTSTSASALIPYLPSPLLGIALFQPSSHLPLSS